jgi:glycosyltransferase involved in cell wall biosynthesis
LTESDGGIDGRLRVLLLSPSSAVRGPIPQHTPHLVAALRELGCEVVERPWGRHADAEAGLRRVTRVLCDVVATRAQLQAQHFDVMVVRTSHGWATLARDIPLMLATRAHVDAIALQFHGSRTDWLTTSGHTAFKALTQLVLRFPDMGLLLSHEEAHHFAQLFPRLACSVVVNAFVPRWELHGGAPNAHENDTNQPLRLLFVGRVIVEKGILDAVRALAIVLRTRECSLQVAGDGPALDELKSLVTDLGLEGKVTLHGYADAQALARLYDSASALVFPTYWKEGFPTVLAEAMYAGVPIVTTQVRGAADYLEEGVNALFVPARDPQAVADAVLRLADDGVLRTQMTNANRVAVRQFSPAQAGRLYLRALRRAIAVSQDRSRS